MLVQEERNNNSLSCWEQRTNSKKSVDALRHYSCCYCAKEMIHVLIATRVKEKRSSSEKDSVVVVKELLNNQAKWRGEKTFPYKMMCTELKDMLIFMFYQSPYISQLIICHCGVVWSEDKKGQDQISESTLNKVSLPANSRGNQMFIEACCRRNLYQISKPKCSSVKTTHDQHQLLTNCPVHFAFTRLTGHKQQAPNLFWHCWHATLMCHFALPGSTSQSQHIAGSWQEWQRSLSGQWSR